MAASVLSRRLWAEAIGTFALVFAGCGAIMVSQRFPGTVAPGAVPVVFGLVVAVMIYSLGHISGAHFNPAVTLGFASVGKLPRREVLPYIAVQVAGAITAIALLAALLPPGQGFGATTPHVEALQAVAWEALLTFFLMFVIVAVATDTRAHGTLAGLAIGAVVCLDAFFGGPVTGASMNPARSLAPALWEGQLSNLWIYVVGPVAGSIAAAFAYEHLR